MPLRIRFAMRAGADDVQLGPVVGQGGTADVRQAVLRVRHFAVETFIDIHVTSLFQLVYMRRKVSFAQSKCRKHELEIRPVHAGEDRHDPQPDRFVNDAIQFAHGRVSSNASLERLPRVMQRSLRSMIRL